MKISSLRGSEKKCNYLLCLFALYLSVAAVRFVLALVTTSFPSVGIDEFLYYSLARSIATEGKLLFRGQPADYAYILYPLLLSPVYLLKEGTHFYRMLQLCNMLLMSASVFPLFFLGKALFKTEKKAFLIAMLCMLLPDFILGELIFSESVLYPLFFSLMYCAFLYFEQGEKRYILWIGVLGGLLYSAKPGAVVPAAVFVFFIFIRSAAGRRGKELIWAALSVFAFFVTAAFFWVLAKYAFGYEGSFLSIYQSQVDGTQGRSLSAFLRALVISPFYFILACGIIGFVYPAMIYDEWKIEIKSFYRFVMISLMLMMIGSAWAVEQVSNLNNIHLRYVAMYIPILILFCCIPHEGTVKNRKNPLKAFPFVRVSLILSYTILCCLIFGCKANAQVSSFHAQMSLSLLNDRFFPVSKQLLGNTIIVLLCIACFILFYRTYRKKRLDLLCCIMIAGFMFINNIFGYVSVHESYFPNLEKDGLAVRELTEGKPYLYSLAGEGIVDIGVDVNVKQNNCIVYTNDLINCLQRNNGVYSPYIPELMRGMLSLNKTPDVDTLIVDYTSYPFLQLSGNTSVSSPYNHDTVFVVHFTPGERMVDSTLSNLTNQTLYPGKPGILLVFNEEYLSNPLNIRMEISSDVEQTMTINSTHELYSIDLSDGRAWYEVTFINAEDAFNFQTQDAPITVYGYELEIMNKEVD